MRPTRISVLFPALALLLAAPPTVRAVEPDRAAASRGSTGVPPVRGEPTSDVLRAPRPQGGEYFGLYLVNKKVGWYFTDLESVPGRPEVRSVADFVFKAVVGNNTAERRHHEERLYESRPGGKLLSFVIKDEGDGGNQVLTGKATPTGFSVKRHRPGQADDTFTLAPIQETVEDADQLRVALLRGKEVSGMALDGTDLAQYRMTTTPLAEERRVVNGVSVLLRKASIVSEKEKVPMQAVVAPDGAVVEMSYGSAMIGRAEPRSVAERLDRVEIFGLTRLVLPSAPPASARKVPGEWSLVLTGFPDKFHRQTDRQSYKDLGAGKSEVIIRAAPPEPEKLVRRGAPHPPDTAEYLKSSILVESDNRAIVAKAKEIAGGETDAYAAAKKVVAWVGRTMKKDYGASADRATDVLRTMRGDCTEHSLLSISLLRALGIPARRVDGVVYVQNEDGVPALYWHEWVEAWVGTWTQLDPTFGQPVADATHLTLGEESSAEIMPLLGELKVVSAR
ncbi:MAG TPA: transglutaminase domain-containing protein [Myxococcaceae bacterium]|nr:transglutaminase domain-containing protein [Myxococcaceae bacterium]